MTNPRAIGVVTSARSDFGLLTGLMRAIQADPDLALIVYASGMHYSQAHGATINEVRDAFPDALVEVPVNLAEDTPQALTLAIGEAVTRFGAAFHQARPDILVILGDRFDAFPAAVAALPFNIPIAHISGGELTEGLIDEAIRHSLTKLSHLHFPSHEDYARRIRQMGEEAWRVTLSGQPGLDAIRSFKPASRDAVMDLLGLDPARPVTLLTYHPETLAHEAVAAAIDAVLTAAASVSTQIVFTAPNADTGNSPIRRAIGTFVKNRADCVYREHLGQNLYFNLLSHAACMVGNSSSGIIEAASFRLPVVNIGERQRGRLTGANVLHCTGDHAAIAEAWRRALDPTFRASLADLVNPYGDGRAVERILSVLKAVELDRKLIVKRYVDWREAPLDTLTDRG